MNKNTQVIKFIKDYFGSEFVPLHRPVFKGNEKVTLKGNFEVNQLVILKGKFKGS